MQLNEVSEATDESSDSEIKNLINQPGDEYFNLDTNLIKQKLQQLQQQHQIKIKQNTAQEENVAKEVKFIPVKHQIESTWSEEKDQLFVEKTKKHGENTDFSKLLNLFPNESEKTLKYHFQVLNQIWTIEQQSLLLQLVQNQLKHSPNQQFTFDNIAKQLNKSKSQCKKHYDKLIQNCFTNEQDQQIMSFCVDQFDKLLKQQLSSDDFTFLQQEMFILKQNLFERFSFLQKESANFDRFWYKKDTQIFQQWWNVNKNLNNSERKWKDLFSILPEYTLFDIARLINQQQT